MIMSRTTKANMLQAREFYFAFFIPSQWNINSQLEKEDRYENFVLFHFLGVFKPIRCI